MNARYCKSVGNDAHELRRTAGSLFSKPLLGILRIYKRWISPFLPMACRFQPTCSEYMVHAVRKKGFFKGVMLGLYRILRCNPFNPGGYDPVK